jgi:lipopolysaccharide biosynthesis glycosyltransferase
MSGERHNVVYSCDGSYWAHLYVSLYSLLMNNPDTAFDVYILTDTPDRRFVDSLPSLDSLHKDFRVQYLMIDPYLFANAPLEIKYFSVATYYRLMIGKILPDSATRLVYIDVDTIVRRPLDDYLALDISDCVLAATPNYFTPDFETIYGSNAARLGMPEGELYFNAGVLLINLDRWRANRVEEQCLEFIHEAIPDPRKLHFADQDPLNAVLVGKWKSVGPNYNYVEWTLDTRRFRDTDVTKQLGGQIPEDGPAIVHYAYPDKPWNGGCPHPYASDYWIYRMRTPYADRKKHFRSKIISAKKWTRRRLGSLARSTLIRGLIARQAASS